MSAELLARIDALVESGARALFATHGLPLGELSDAPGDAPHDAPHDTPADHDIACSIGFTSPKMHGAVLMTARRDVIARAWPAELRHRAPSEREVCDWAGELLNQLLGRVKNGLAPLGLTLEQGTPTVVVGWQVHRAPSSTAPAPMSSRRYLFDGKDSSIAVYLDAVVAEGATFSEPGSQGVASAVEGDVQLF